MAFAELFELAFEVGLDAEKTDEEKEMLLEEATEEAFATVFGTAFMEAVTELEEIESELSEETVEVLSASGCIYFDFTDFVGEPVGQSEVPVTDDYADLFESAAPVEVGASVEACWTTMANSMCSCSMPKKVSCTKWSLRWAAFPTPC